MPIWVDPRLGEVDYPELYRSPARSIVDTLSKASDMLAVYDGGLPSGLMDARAI
ncbi:hypothetical protein ACWEOI_35330 [Nocardia sp. NPDC004340]